MYSNHYMIIKYVSFELIHYTINLNLDVTCDTPIPGVPLTTRQPVETRKYRVSRYHTYLSHILRLIPAYLIHKYTKIYARLFNQQIHLTVLLYNKKVYMFWLCSNIIHDKNKTKQNRIRLSSLMRSHMWVRCLHRTCT